MWKEAFLTCYNEVIIPVFTSVHCHAHWNVSHEGWLIEPGTS
jgi:hypothetical protein